MTRKNYESVARMLKVQLSNTKTRREMELVSLIARNMAWEFSQVNGNFRFDSFYAACGLDPSGWAEWIEATSC